MKNLKVDVLIIGAGPSGAIAAAYLYKQGFAVKVVEKSKFPRFVIGESLLPKCMEHFEEVGLLDALREKQFEVKGGARFMRDSKICNFDFSKKYTDGWDWTWQVPRAEFDKTLTDTLESWGVDIAFEQEVVAVEFEGANSKTTVKGIEGNTTQIEAKFIVDSSGHGRVLPRLLGLDKPSDIPKHSSIFTHVKDVNRPEGREGTIITFDIVSKETWFWVIPFSNGYTSIGYVGPTEYLASFNNDPVEKLKEMLPLSEYYLGRFKDVPFEFKPVSIQNIAKSVTKLYGDGFVLTGNSAEFLDPVFSSGVTFATESSLVASKLIAKQLKGEKANWETEYVDHMKAGVEVFATYVKEWYTGNLQTIFFTDNENPTIKAQICAVLAGYVWDKTNPFVKNHHRLVKTVARIAEMESE